MRAFGDMQTEVKALIQNTGSGIGTTVKNAIRRAYRWAGESKPWPSLRHVEEFTTAANGRLIFPQYVRRVTNLFDDGSKHEIIIEPQLQSKFPSTYETGGTAYRATYEGVWPVAVQPSAAGTISVKGDGGGDTGHVIRIRGYVAGTTSTVAGNMLRVESVTTNGGSAVATTASFSWLTEITTEDDLDDDILIYDGSTTYYGMLQRDKRAARHKVYRLHYRPGSGTTIRALFERYPPRLINDADCPIIPVSDAIVYKAASELLMRDKLATRSQVLYGQAVAALDHASRQELSIDGGMEQAVPHRAYARDYEGY